MAVTGRNFQHFQQGAGVAPEPREYSCADCGYSSTNRKHFKRTDDEDSNARTCSTGHFERDGELKRAKNPYARR